MERSEVRTLARHLPLALAHPRWWFAFVRGGRRGLLRAIVADSLRAVRSQPVATSLAEAAGRPLTAPLGQLGAPQEVLYHLVRWLRPARVVETGVYRGISSAFLLAGLADNGTGSLVSIDLPSASYPGDTGPDASPLAPGEATGYVVPDELRVRWRLVVGSSREQLPAVAAEGSIDLFLHDSEHTVATMVWEYTTAWAALRPGGLLVSDDVDWNEAFTTFTQDAPTDFVRVRERRLGIARKAERGPGPSTTA